MNWYELFPTVFNMSLTASAVILFVLILRLILKRFPKIFSYALWAVVLFRLLCPVTLTSEFSLLHLFDVPVESTSEFVSTIEYIPHDLVHTENPEIQLPILGTSNFINDHLPQGQHQLTADPLEAPVSIATYIWLAGLFTMVVYSVISYLNLTRKLIGAIQLYDNIFLTDYIDSPFVLGWFSSKIYLPSSLQENEQKYIILHEQHHIRRFDHFTRMLAFVSLCIHWFNPLVWLAFVLSGKDMEMSCDEAVIQQLGEDIRADYSASLLSLATGQHIIAGIPLAFTEKDTKTRIKNLSMWKKPVLTFSIMAACLILFASILLFTNPLKAQTKVMGAEYAIKEVLYAVTIGDEISKKPPVSYSVTADYQLYVQHNAGDDWVHLGQLEPYDLTQKELKQYTPVDVMRKQYTLSEITDSYILHIEQDNFYLVFQTKDGKTYLGYGWEDVSERYQDASDDTRLRRLYLLENTFDKTAFYGGFFKRSLIHQVNQNVDPFSYTASDDFPGFIIIGFMANGTSQKDMTDMGYAVFQQASDNGYKLLDWHVYPDAAIQNNGIHFCSDPATMNTTGELKINETYDVIISCNEELKTIKRVIHYPKNNSDIITNYPVIGNLTLTLISWSDSGAATSTSIYYLDENGEIIR